MIALLGFVAKAKTKKELDADFQALAKSTYQELLSNLYM